MGPDNTANVETVAACMTRVCIYLTFCFSRKLMSINVGGKNIFNVLINKFQAIKFFAHYSCALRQIYISTRVLTIVVRMVHSGTGVVLRGGGWDAKVSVKVFWCQRPFNLLFLIVEELTLMK